MHLKNYKLYVRGWDFFHVNLMVESGDFCNYDVHAPYAMLDKK